MKYIAIKGPTDLYRGAESKIMQPGKKFKGGINHFQLKLLNQRTVINTSHKIAETDISVRMVENELPEYLSVIKAQWEYWQK